MPTYRFVLYDDASVVLLVTPLDQQLVKKAKFKIEPQLYEIMDMQNARGPGSECTVFLRPVEESAGTIELQVPFTQSRVI